MSMSLKPYLAAESKIGMCEIFKYVHCFVSVFVCDTSPDMKVKHFCFGSVFIAKHQRQNKNCMQILCALAHS